MRVPFILPSRLLLSERLCVDLSRSNSDMRAARVCCGDLFNLPPPGVVMYNKK